MNLDERIDDIVRDISRNDSLWDSDDQEDATRRLKQLIGEAIDYCTPIKGIVVGDSGIDQEHTKHLHKAIGYIESKKQELGL